MFVRICSQLVSAHTNFLRECAPATKRRHGLVKYSACWDLQPIVNALRMRVLWFRLRADCELRIVRCARRVFSIRQVVMNMLVCRWTAVAQWIAKNQSLLAIEHGRVRSNFLQSQFPQPRLISAGLNQTNKRSTASCMQCTKPLERIRSRSLGVHLGRAAS